MIANTLTTEQRRYVLEQHKQFSTTGLSYRGLQQVLGTLKREYQVDIGIALNKQYTILEACWRAFVDLAENKEPDDSLQITTIAYNGSGWYELIYNNSSRTRKVHGLTFLTEILQLSNTHVYNLPTVKGEFTDTNHFSNYNREQNNALQQNGSNTRTDLRIGRNYENQIPELPRSQTAVAETEREEVPLHTTRDERTDASSRKKDLDIYEQRLTELQAISIDPEESRRTVELYEENRKKIEEKQRRLREERESLHTSLFTAIDKYEDTARVAIRAAANFGFEVGSSGLFGGVETTGYEPSESLMFPIRGNGGGCEIDGHSTTDVTFETVDVPLLSGEITDETSTTKKPRPLVRRSDSEILDSDKYYKVFKRFVEGRNNHTKKWQAFTKDYVTHEINGDEVSPIMQSYCRLLNQHYPQLAEEIRNEYTA